MSGLVDRRGFALIGVLWIVVLIAIVGLEFSLRAREVTQRVAGASERSAARAAAEGCLVHAAAQLRDRLARSPVGRSGSLEVFDPWRAPASIQTDTLQVGEARCHVRYADAGERLNLNNIGERELRLLMTELRLDVGDADRLAQAILDWRDPDGFRRARGAELDEYLQAGAPVLPPNAPFAAVDELRLVLGMTERVYTRIAPALTVSGTGRVNLNSAPAEVIAALPGMSEALLALVLRVRAQQGIVPDLLTLSNDLDDRARERLRVDLVTLQGMITNATEAVLVQSLGWIPGGSITVEITTTAVRGSGQAVFMTERRLR